MSEKVVVRTSKTGSKSSKATLKMNDVSKPGKTAASSTSKPVIVSNRPLMQDPMMLSNATMAESTEEQSPIRGKIKIQPLSASEKNADAAPAAKKADKSSDLPLAISLTDDAAPKSDDKADTAADTFGSPDEKPAGAPPVDEKLLDETPAESAPTTGKPADAKSADEKPAEKKLAANPLASSDAVEEKDEDEEKDDESAAPAEAVPDKGSSSSSRYNSPSESPVTPEVAAGEAGVNEKAAAELEAETKKLALIDELVDNKTYFLPINAAERRRSAIMSGLGFLLILVLGLFLVNLLMDIGTLEISGVKPLTNFFGN